MRCRCQFERNFPMTWQQPQQPQHPTSTAGVVVRCVAASTDSEPLPPTPHSENLFRKTITHRPSVRPSVRSTLTHPSRYLCIHTHTHTRQYVLCSIHSARAFHSYCTYTNDRIVTATSRIPSRTIDIASVQHRFPDNYKYSYQYSGPPSLALTSIAFTTPRTQRANRIYVLLILYA